MHRELVLDAELARVEQLVARRRRDRRLRGGGGGGRPNGSRLAFGLRDGRPGRGEGHDRLGGVEDPGVGGAGRVAEGEVG